MILIRFADRDTEIKGLACLLGRFPGKVLPDRQHIVSESAVSALATQNTPFTVKGTATHEHQMAALRGAAAETIQ